MQYLLVIQTYDRDGQVSITPDVALAIVQAAERVDGVKSAGITQMGIDLKYPLIPLIP